VVADALFAALVMAIFLISETLFRVKNDYGDAVNLKAS